ncbi:MAG: hypothetical protein LUC34_05325, partial [Campylobacter sp.]|nr:hypothetical protein [Campylobacter sp.]
MKNIFLKSVLMTFLTSSIALAAQYVSAPTQDELNAAKRDIIDASGVANGLDFDEKIQNIASKTNYGEAIQNAAKNSDFDFSDDSENDNVDLLEGDVKLACEAILCLSGGSS